jgi:hypothetical protein
MNAQNDSITSVNTPCSATNEGTGNVCLGAASPRHIGKLFISLCEAHLHDMGDWGNYKARRLVAELVEDGCLLHHTKGLTYVVQMHDGTVKIGMTGKPNLERLQAVSLRYNDGIPVRILAVLQGGRSRDAMEMYDPAGTLLAWASGQASLPLSSEIATAIKVYDAWSTGRRARSAKAGMQQVAARVTLKPLAPPVFA